MRLKTEFWIKAYLRRVRSLGAFAAVLHHGDDDNGIIYVKLNRLDGSATLFGPAPPSLDRDADGDDERRFVRDHKPRTLIESEVDALVNRHRDFDPDIWVVEIESRDGQHGLDDWFVTPNQDR